MDSKTGLPGFQSAEGLMKATDATSDINLAILVGLRITGWVPGPHYTAAQQIAEARASGNNLQLT